jgi:CheY-like chemotaxis protein
MLNILLVEDDPDLREAIYDLLSRKYTVTQAENGKVGQELLEVEHFDLVISDAQMPQMNGVDLLRWIKKEKPTPFILMTGYSDLLETQSIFSLNIDNFIIKPFQNIDLLTAIQEVIHILPARTGTR